MKPALLSFLLAAAILAGCYRGPGTAESRSGGTLYPLGVLRPTENHPDIGTVTGIYPAATSDDPLCCWMGDASAFEIRIPQRANELVVTAFIPGLKVFDGRTQTVDVAVDGSPATHFTLHKGANFLHVPIHPSDADRVGDVSMTAGFTFTPQSQHINGDTRQLSLYLKAVRAERR